MGTERVWSVVPVVPVEPKVGSFERFLVTLFDLAFGNGVKERGNLPCIKR